MTGADYPGTWMANGHSTSATGMILWFQEDGKPPSATSALQPTPATHAADHRGEL
ncbi:MAG: hypothetical protein QGI84_11195 [Dehalococcoidia bacterium]|nr:hypothetical protein [Dehalococcoidia bacterium]